MAAAAVADRDEVQRIALGGMGDGLQRGLARHRDRGRRQAGAGVGVVRGVGGQVAAADVARVSRAHAVDHGGIGLQAHADLQPAREQAGDLRPFLGDAGFLLDDGGQGQRLVLALQRQVRRARGPGRIQRLLHRIVCAPEDVEVGIAAHPGIGFRQEAAFRMLAGMAQRLHQCRVVEFLAVVPQPFDLGQRRAQVADVPAFDDGEAAPHHLAVAHRQQQRLRGGTRCERVLADLQPPVRVQLPGQQSPLQQRPGAHALFLQPRDHARQ